MASAHTAIKNILGVKHVIVTDMDFFADSNGVNHFQIHVEPYKRYRNLCPICYK